MKILRCAQNDKMGTLRMTKGGHSEGYGPFGSAQGAGWTKRAKKRELRPNKKVTR